MHILYPEINKGRHILNQFPFSKLNTKLKSSVDNDHSWHINWFNWKLFHLITLYLITRTGWRIPCTRPLNPRELFNSLTQCDFLCLLSSDFGRCFNYLMKLSVHHLWRCYHESTTTTSKNPRLLSHLINLFFQHSVNQLCNEGCERNSKFQDETATTPRSSRNHAKHQVLESAYMAAKWDP